MSNGVEKEYHCLCEEVIRQATPGYRKILDRHAFPSTETLAMTIFIFCAFVDLPACR